MQNDHPDQRGTIADCYTDLDGTWSKIGHAYIHQPGTHETSASFKDRMARLTRELCRAGHSVKTWFLYTPRLICIIAVESEPQPAPREPTHRHTRGGRRRKHRSGTDAASSAIRG